MKFLPLIWAGLWRKPLRTLFTMLSILVAFLLFGMLQGVNSGLNHSAANAHVNRLLTISRTSFVVPLPFAYLPQIEAVPGVSGATYTTWFGSYFQDPKNFVAAFPIVAERYFTLYPELKLPPDQRDALSRTRTGAVIGAELAKKYGWKIGDRVPLHSTIWVKGDGNSDWSFEVVGIFDDPEDPAQANGMFFNFSYFDEARSLGKGTVGWYIVGMADPGQAAQVGAAIDHLFANSSDETKSQTEKEFSQALLKQVGDINFIVTAILGAVFFTLLFLTGNTMMQSFRERIPELAVLKTLGFTGRGVLALVLAETVVLCLSASVLGLAIAAAIFPYLAATIGVVSLAPEVAALGVGIAVLLAFVTGLPPALRAQRLNIVDALAGR
jgi:putative ABC transport system permease protein